MSYAYLPKIPYAEETDEYLIELIREGDQLALEYLVSKYRPLVLRKAGHYFLPGAEYQDLMQEGMIGLLKAVRDYRPEVARFQSFAHVCVERHLQAVVKAKTRKKHTPLNDYISFSLPLYSEGEATLEDRLPSHHLTDPLEIVIGRAKAGTAFKELRRVLSDLEWRVFLVIMNGLVSYKEIAREAGITAKSADNTIQRVRHKARRLFLDDLK